MTLSGRRGIAYLIAAIGRVAAFLSLLPPTPQDQEW